jgi:hypothetical protein
VKNEWAKKAVVCGIFFPNAERQKKTYGSLRFQNFDLQNLGVRLLNGRKKKQFVALQDVVFYLFTRHKIGDNLDIRSVKTKGKEADMRTYKIGICDRNPQYAVRVAEFINGGNQYRLQAVAFTGMQAVADYLTGQDLDMVLTDDMQGCRQEESGFFFCDIPCVALLEKKSREDRGIFKYQDIQTVCREALLYLAPEREPTTRVFTCSCVFSPLGRCGKTRFAMALAAEDEVRGGLYVGMEEYSGLSADLEAPGILYQLKERMEALEDMIDSQLIPLENIKILQAAGAYFDTREITAEDIAWLNDSFSRSGRFSTVVYDIGGSSLMDYGILDCFDHIYMPVLPDEISKNKIKRLESMLRDMGYRKLLRKIIRLEVPDADFRSTEMTQAIWNAKHRVE